MRIACWRLEGQDTFAFREMDDLSENELGSGIGEKWYYIIAEKIIEKAESLLNIGEIEVVNLGLLLIPLLNKNNEIVFDLITVLIHKR